jgi:hypothetical protein
MAKIYGEIGGKVLEIQNWRDRASGDAVVMQRLNTSTTHDFRELRSEGLSDSQIFTALHPEAEVEGTTVRKLKPTETFAQEPPPVNQLTYRIDQLPKAQLIWLIESVMGQKAESLAMMSQSDLINLARFTTKGRKVELTFLP